MTRPAADDGGPWSLTVGFVNPNDVIYFNTNAPGQQMQDTDHFMKRAVGGQMDAYPGARQGFKS